MDEQLKKLMKQDAGSGLEDFQAQDFTAPFLILLQTGSPQLNEQHPMYLPDARPGRILNTQSGTLYKECHVIPCKYNFRSVEWKPRSGGGGFVASYERGHEPTDLISDPMTGGLKRPNGNVMQQTSYYLCLLKEENNERVIIAMTSTQLKKARRWNTVIASQRQVFDGSSVPLPIFAYYYKLSVTAESNNKGTWFGWSIMIDSLVEDTLTYSVAKETNRIQNFLPERLLANLSQGGGSPDDESVM